ncbi:BRO family protein [Aurantimonas sp. MSK8Z-1]|uniref:BRO-N domain-containing protein n=1 Tax=Mangrovibrevibacter kandeliae TaxID=2968473 RepID=UPI0021179105|nr:BRO family protein [Aurantimonas sp. MSK8Z-1]MCW4114758.1 BRO family protein [Aurantimonas sp. MSK8Z-1]
MNALQTFDFDGDPVRIDFDGEPLFNGKDCCRCLAIENHRDALGRVPEDEKGVGLTDTLGGEQLMIWLREPGLYRLIFQSRKPEAERFKRWVFHEVLPAIRRTGAYGRGSLPLADIAQLARTCDAVRRTHGRPAARALWADLGGPDLPLEPGARPTSTVDAGAHQARLVPVLAEFIASCCEDDPAAQVQARPLYQAFARWAAVSDGVPTMTETMFGRTMVLAGHRREDRAGGRFWLGLRLKAEVLRRIQHGDAGC